MPNLFSFFHGSSTATNELGTELVKLHTILQKSQQDFSTVQAQNQKLNQILENMPEGIIAINQNRQITYLNQTAKHLTGLGNEALNQPIDQIIQFKDKANTLTFLHFCPIRENYNGIIFKSSSLKIIGKTESYINLITTQIQGAGLPPTFILTLLDISQEKSFEEMKFDFVSLAAHELRTPLTSIKGYLSVFLQENKETLSPDQKELLSQATRATEQLNSLVENLLSVSRIERGVLAVNLEPVDWVSFVKNAVNDLVQRATEKEIHLEFILPSQTIPQIKVDKLRITEVLNNLLSNAIKYTEPRGQINVSVETKEGSVITHIKDTGHGISQDAINQLFNKFFRVSGPLEGGTKGTGLGLYITKSLIEMHHGKIWVTSEVDKGSNFSFSLPI